MRVHLQALGCRLNEAELERWARDFRAQGIEPTEDLAEADLVVVNTCAVTAESVRKSRNLVRRAQRANPRARLVMSGCYAALSPEQAAEELGVDLVVDNRDKDRLVEIARRELALPVMPRLAIEPGESSLLARGRQRAFIKVQDGCRYRCTYCVVTLARGEERSRPVDEVVAEVRQVHAEGVQEVVLAGVHLGGYGSDSGGSLAELVAAVLARTEVPRVRLGSLEPWDLPPDFWALFDDPRLMPHLHLPMQSGADSVLRRMSRRCRSGEFLALAEAGRARVPDLQLTTDIIVGFPGETEAEWRQTLAFVTEARFAQVHIFPFSPREGTKAATLPNPVDRGLIRERSRQLHEQVAAMRREILHAQVGRRWPVLLEGRPQQGEAGMVWRGYTPHFLRVQVPAPAGPSLEGQVREVRVSGVDEAALELLGEPA